MARTKKAATKTTVKTASVSETPAKSVVTASEEKAVKAETAKTDAAKETVKAAAETKPAEAPVAEKTEDKPKKPAAKKTTAKTAEVKTEMFLQFAGKEYTEKEIFQKVKDVWTKVLKNKVGDLKDVKIYLKPEDSAAYYVINGDTTGRVEL